MSSQPDLMLILINIGRQIPTFIMLAQVISGFAALYFVGTGIIDLWLANYPGSEKHFSGARHASNMGAFAKLFGGGLFACLATLQLVGVLSRSITGDYVNSRALSYSTGGGSFAEQAQLATLAMLGIMQAVGMCAIFRGITSLIERGNGSKETSFGKITIWFIGGLLAWNFKWFSDVVNNTIGFNVISLFTPWS